jgi:uncharacterized protein YoxC
MATLNNISNKLDIDMSDAISVLSDDSGVSVCSNTELPPPLDIVHEEEAKTAEKQQDETLLAEVDAEFGDLMAEKDDKLERAIEEAANSRQLCDEFQIRSEEQNELARQSKEEQTGIEAEVQALKDQQKELADKLKILSEKILPLKGKVKEHNAHAKVFAKLHKQAEATNKQDEKLVDLASQEYAGVRDKAAASLAKKRKELLKPVSKKRKPKAPPADQLEVEKQPRLAAEVISNVKTVVDPAKPNRIVFEYSDTEEEEEREPIVDSKSETEVPESQSVVVVSSPAPEADFEDIPQAQPFEWDYQDESLARYIDDGNISTAGSACDAKSDSPEEEEEEEDVLKAIIQELEEPKKVPSLKIPPLSLEALEEQLQLVQEEIRNLTSRTKVLNDQRDEKKRYIQENENKFTGNNLVLFRSTQGDELKSIVNECSQVLSELQKRMDERQTITTQLSMRVLADLQ